MAKPKTYLYLTGTSGTSAHIPSNATGFANLNFTGGFEVVMRLNPMHGWRQRFTKALWSHYNPATNQRRHRLFLLTSGILRLTLSANGLTATDHDSTVAIPDNATARWIRVVYDPTNTRVQFFYANDQATEPTSWTQLGANVTTAVASLFVASTENFYIGGNTNTYNTSPTEQFKGEVYKFTLRELSGAVQLNADFTTATIANTRPANIDSPTITDLGQVSAMFFRESSANQYNIIFRTLNFGTAPDTREFDQVRIIGLRNQNKRPPKQKPVGSNLPPITVVTAPTITKTVLTGSVSGNLIAISGGPHTPIFSTPSNIYVLWPSFLSATQQTRAARFNKSLVEQEERQILAAPLDGDPGHQQGAIAVDNNGIVLAYAEGHNRSWRLYQSASSENMSTMTLVPKPNIEKFLNGNVEDIWAYHSLFRNPNNGDIWFMCRGYGYYGYLFKWDEVNRIMIPKGHPSGAVVGFGTSKYNSVYGHKMAFASDGTIYLYYEYKDGGPTNPFATGYPRRDGFVIKSVDDGNTWTDMVGGELTTPIGSNTSHVAFPTGMITVNDYSNSSVVQAGLVVMPDGQPAVIAAYARRTEPQRHLYISRWNQANKQFEWQKIMNQPDTGLNFGNVSTMYHNNKIYILVSTKDEHFDPGWLNLQASYPFSLSAGNTPFTNWSDKPILYMFMSADGGLNWNRYELDNGAGTHAYWGGYFDTEAPRLDNKIRIQPICGTDTTRAEIWEMALV